MAHFVGQGPAHALGNSGRAAVRRDGLLEVGASDGAHLRACGYRAGAAEAALQLGRQQPKVLGHVGQPRPLDAPPQVRRAIDLACNTILCWCNPHRQADMGHTQHRCKLLAAHIDLTVGLAKVCMCQGTALKGSRQSDRPTDCLPV